MENLGTQTKSCYSRASINEMCCEEKAMRILGLDLSTKAGVSIVEAKGSGKVLHASTITFPKLTGWDRVTALASAIEELKAKFKPDCAMIEDYAVSRFGGSAITSIEIGTVIRYLMWQDDFPYMDISPTTLKKFVTGAGNSKKDMMVLGVFKKFGYEAASNDDADAVALGYLGACVSGRITYSKTADAELTKTCFKQNPAFKFPSVA